MFANIATKTEEIRDFIELIENDRVGAVIARNTYTGEYATYATVTRLDDNEILVYSYAMYVNSSANLEVEDIATRF